MYKTHAVKLSEEHGKFFLSNEKYKLHFGNILLRLSEMESISSIWFGNGILFNLTKDSLT